MINPCYWPCWYSCSALLIMLMVLVAFLLGEYNPTLSWSLRLRSWVQNENLFSLSFGKLLLWVEYPTFLWTCIMLPLHFEWYLQWLICWTWILNKIPLISNSPILIFCSVYYISSLFLYQFVDQYYLAMHGLGFCFRVKVFSLYRFCGS